ncbi:MAG: flagellar basal body-associated FliL family protein [Paracoccaceae bacterium]
MRKLILPILLGTVGLAGGGGAGYFLRPAADPAAGARVEVNPCGPPGQGEAKTDAPEGGDAPAREYVKLNNQFIVPVVETGKVQALVILSVSLEVRFGTSQAVYAIEPKLRDALLQVLFDHANSGGFDGAFTDATTMDDLRAALLETARKSLGSEVTDVLITDIVRQDS